LAAHEVGDHVRGGDGDDEIAVRHDQAADRDDVPEHGHVVARSFDVPRALQLTRRYVGGAQRASADRHAAVHHHHEQVEAEPDGHHAHSGEVQVGECEPDE